MWLTWIVLLSSIGILTICNFWAVFSGLRNQSVWINFIWTWEAMLADSFGRSCFHFFSQEQVVFIKLVVDQRLKLWINHLLVCLQYISVGGHISNIRDWNYRISLYLQCFVHFCIIIICWYFTLSKLPFLIIFMSGHLESKVHSTCSKWPKKR